MIDRLQTPPGALLASRDLTDAGARAELLRALHVRAVHATWGVALGFAVERSPDGRGAVVAPGLAYESCGREIVNPQQRVVPLGRASVAPPGTWLDLLVGRRRRGPGPELRWSVAGGAAAPGQPPLGADVRRGEEVPLARARLAAGGVLGPLDLSRRPTVQPLAKPRVGAGRVPPGAPVVGTRGAWSLHVDAADAGFTGAPRYVATLDAHPLEGGPEDPRSVLGPFANVVAPAAAGFTLEVRLAARGPLAPSLFHAQATLPVGVTWLGVEPRLGCPPIPTTE